MDNIITQLSIFVNNEPGRLAAIAGVLRECNINMKAFNLAESVEFGILRAIVDEPAASFDALKKRGIVVKKTDVIAVIINDKPGSIFETASVLGAAGINIEYGYAYANNGRAIIFLRVDDPKAAIEALSKAGISTMKESDI
jgi:hypothetical protein